MKKRIVMLAAALSLLLCACGGEGALTGPSPEQSMQPGPLLAQSAPPEALIPEQVLTE